MVGAEFELAGANQDVQVIPHFGHVQVGGGGFDFAQVQRVLDPEHPGVRRFDEPDGFERDMEDFLVGGEMHGDGGRRGVLSGNGVDVRRVVVDFLDQAVCGKFGHTDSHGVAVGFFREIPDEEPQDAGRVSVHRSAFVAFTPHHVGIDAGAADVFTHLVDDQQVHVVEGQPGTPGLGFDQKLLFHVFEVRRGNGGNLRRFVVAVFEQGDAECDRHFFPDRLPHNAYDLVEGMVDDSAVVNGGAFVLAEADEHHFHQAAFDLADEAGVGFDAVDDDHVVGFRGAFVEIDGHAEIGNVNFNNVHGGFDRGADCLFCDAVPRQNLRLALGCAAAVATHRRNDKGPGAKRDHFFDERSDDCVQVGDAPGSRGNRYGVPGLDGFAGVEIPDFAPRGARNIVNARRVEALANPKHVGVLHVEPPVLDDESLELSPALMP